MYKSVVIAIIFSLFVICAFAQEEQPAAAQNQLLVLENFKDECPTGETNEEARNKASHIFAKITNDCLQKSPLLWVKHECSDQGFKLSVCLEENCQNCASRDIAKDECVGSSKFICSTQDKVAEFVNLNEELIRVSVHTIKKEEEQKEQKPEQPQQPSEQPQQPAKQPEEETPSREFEVSKGVISSADFIGTQF